VFERVHTKWELEAFTKGTVVMLPSIDVSFPLLELYEDLPPKDDAD